MAVLIFLLLDVN